MRPRLRAKPSRRLLPRHAQSTYDVPVEEWLRVPVPALVSEELFDAVQPQLEENRRRARLGRRGARYLARKGCSSAPAAAMPIMARR
jgi:site-specific DNA recombinase